MEENILVGNSELEESILKAIAKIKKNRSRPCSQSILTALNRGKGEDKLSKDVLAVSLNDLLNKKIICNNGKSGQESYSLEKMEDLKSAGIDEGIGDKEITTLESFIDDTFYNTLINRIKSEVNNAVNIALNTKYNGISDNSNSNDNGDIYNSLKDEINFLRQEIESKNKIIDILLSDQKNKLEGLNNNEPFIYPKKSARYSGINSVNNPITVENSYSSLKFEKSGRDNDIILNNTKLSDQVENVSNTDTSNRREKKRNITVIGDSLLKDIKQHRMRRDLSSNDKLYIKTFPGATTDCMKSYVIPTLKYEPDLVLLHCGSNDLRSQKSPEEIAESIVDLAKSMKKDSNDIIISGIVTRNDEWNEKGIEVNDYLYTKCNEQDIFFSDNSNISGKKHLNLSGLHLNHKGTFVLANNILDSINL